MPYKLSDSARAEIDAWLTKFPPEHKKSGLLYALMVGQKEHGYLSEDVKEAIASYLELPRIKVDEVATFYTMYESSPVGRYKLAVCTSISCKLMGSDVLMTHISEVLGIDVGKTTDDKLFTLKPVGCLGACIGAPVIQLNDQQYYETMTAEKITDLLSTLRTEAITDGQ
jgi:NADH-quinone oxidoreductase subunit E